MARPLTRPQLLENRAFLKALERSGNVRLAARATDVKYGTMQHRRKHHPAFAARWDAALAVAQARLAAGGLQGPRAAAAPAGTGAGAGAGAATGAEKGSAAHRTRGGEGVVVRLGDGKYQVRAAQPGKLTQACEQAFLAALSATANVRLSAAAAGASARAFYRRRRTNPAFAREMRLALQRGYESIELALLAGLAIEAHADDAWRHNDPPAMPRMTPGEALQLLYLHQKETRLWCEPPHLKRRPGESRESHLYRLGEMAQAKWERDGERDRLAQAARDDARSPHEPPPPSLPALDQVTGWSRASGKPPHHEGRALFGGWRLGDLKGKRK